MVREIAFSSDLLRFVYRMANWHLRFMSGIATLPLACGLYLSSKCNFRCSFCNIWRIKPAFQLSRETALKLAGELGELGLVYFSISGGEPLLIPYVFDVLSKAKESGVLYTHIVSNGYLMDENRAVQIADAGVSEISFSLDGEESVHDRNRAMPGAFRKVIGAVENVRKKSPETKIILNTILGPKTPGNALFAIKLAGKMGIKIKVQPENDHPPFGIEENAQKVDRFLGSDAAGKLLDVIEEIKTLPHVVNSKPFMDNYKAFMFHPEKLFLSKEECIFGYHHVEMFANQLFPCLEGMGWKNAFEVSGTPVKNLFLSSPYRNKLQELRKCSGCRKNYYVCYYEPRLNFPIWNLLKSRLLTGKA